jgi:hypothetical protein
MWPEYTPQGHCCESLAASSCLLRRLRTVFGLAIYLKIRLAGEWLAGLFSFLRVAKRLLHLH